MSSTSNLSGEPPLRSRTLACLLVTVCCTACYSTRWSELPSPADVPAGGQVRVTAGGDQVELFDVFIQDDSLLVGSRPPSTPGWAMASEPIPFAAIDRVEVGERVFRKKLTAVLWIVGAVTVYGLLSNMAFMPGAP